MPDEHHEVHVRIALAAHFFSCSRQFNVARSSQRTNRARGATQ